MAITKEQAIDILDKFDFFQGQRAGRELWNDKPFDVQEEDIKAFSRDVAELKAYIADVVPKSEVVLASSDAVKMLIDCHGYFLTHDADIKKEVAREIFEEVEKLLDNHHSACLPVGEIEAYTYYEGGLGDAISELKKKYTEGTRDD